MDGGGDVCGKEQGPLGIQFRMDDLYGWEQEKEEGKVYSLGVCVCDMGLERPPPLPSQGFWRP